MTPFRGWAVACKGLRSEWSAFGFAGRTRAEAKALWVEGYQDPEIGERLWREKTRSGQIRLARVIVSEDLGGQG